MKRLILILCVAVFGFAHQAKAQWTVLDPSNLVQNLHREQPGQQCKGNGKNL